MKTYNLNSKDVVVLLDHYIQNEKLPYDEAEQMVKQVIISNELVKNNRKKRRQALPYILGSLFFGSLISLLLAVNAIEFDNVTLAVGAIWGVISLAIMGLSALFLRRYE